MSEIRIEKGRKYTMIDGTEKTIEQMDKLADKVNKYDLEYESIAEALNDSNNSLDENVFNTFENTIKDTLVYLEDRKKELNELKTFLMNNSLARDILNLSDDEKKEKIKEIDYVLNAIDTQIINKIKEQQKEINSKIALRKYNVDLKNYESKLKQFYQSYENFLKGIISKDYFDDKLSEIQKLCNNIQTGYNSISSLLDIKKPVSMEDINNKMKETKEKYDLDEDVTKIINELYSSEEYKKIQNLQNSKKDNEKESTDGKTRTLDQSDIPVIEEDEDENDIELEDEIDEYNASLKKYNEELKKFGKIYTDMLDGRISNKECENKANDLEEEYKKLIEDYARLSKENHVVEPIDMFEYCDLIYSDHKKQKLNDKYKDKLPPGKLHMVNENALNKKAKFKMFVKGAAIVAAAGAGFFLGSITGITLIAFAGSGITAVAAARKIKPIKSYKEFRSNPNMTISKEIVTIEHEDGTYEEKYKVDILKEKSINKYVQEMLEDINTNLINQENNIANLEESLIRCEDRKRKLQRQLDLLKNSVNSKDFEQQATQAVIDEIDNIIENIKQNLAALGRSNYAPQHSNVNDQSKSALNHNYTQELDKDEAVVSAFNSAENIFDKNSDDSKQGELYTSLDAIDEAEEVINKNEEQNYISEGKTK